MYVMNEIQKIRSIKWNVYTLTIYKGIFNKVFAIIDMAKQYESIYKNKENSNMPLIDLTVGLKGIFVGNYN